MSQRLPSEVFVPPLPSFPVPVEPPLTDGDEAALCIPENWIPYVRGALQQLIQPTTWAGTEEEIKAAQETAATIIAMMEEGACATEAEAPTPYWDDTTDLEDQEPADEQQWYGIFDGTFQETLENFVIAGFIAYSGQIGAAITFLTLAPRFRLAWKTGDLGGIIRVIIDGADNGTVDTFSETEGVIEQDYVGDPAETEHTILMVLEEVP